jgi:hypothetical protein
MITNLKDLYSHSCADRNNKGGDIHDLLCQIGKLDNDADAETLAGIGHQTEQLQRRADYSVDGQRSTGSTDPVPDMNLERVMRDTLGEGESESDIEA